MTLRYLLFVGVLLFSLNTNAQSFHRIYEVNEQGDTLLHHLASTTNSLGQFISVSGRQIDGEYKSLVFTKQDTKGNFENKRQYLLGEEGQVTDIQNIDMMIHEQVADTIFFAATLIIDDSPQAMVGKLHSSRLDGFMSKTVTGLDSEFEPIWEGVSRKGQVTSYLDSTYIYSVSDTVVSINRLEKDHTVRWTQKYVLSDTLGEAFDAMGFETDISDADSTIYSMGLLNSFDLYQLVIDSLSIEQMAKSYTIDGDVNPVPTGLKTVQEDDAVLAGYYTKNNGSSESYLFMTDTIGEVTWAKRVVIEGVSTEIYNIAQNTDGDIIISGKFFPEPDSTKLFAAAVNLQGEVTWITSFGPRPVDKDLKLTSLDAIPEGGVNIAANGFAESGEPGLTFIKLSASGNTACSDTLVPTQFSDLSITTDTLLINRTIGIMMGDSIMYIDTSYSNIIEPQLDIDPRPEKYCPNEVIDELLTASVSNVDLAKVSYEWVTGDLTDTTRVHMDTVYTVTVTISENSCYMMCDTVQLERSTEPTVQIQPYYGRYCEFGEIELLASIEGGKSSFEFLWNTGETTEQITTTQIGEYSVRVIDSCQDTVFSEESIIPPLNELTLNGSINDDCQNVAILEVTPTSTLGSSSISFAWDDDDNSTTDTLTVTESGKYTVVVTDACGDMASFEFDVEIEELPELTVDIRNEGCNESGQIVLDADPTGDMFTYLWSNSEVSESIKITGQGIYSVTVTDNECGATGKDSFEYIPTGTLSIIDISDNCDSDILPEDVRYTVNFEATENVEAIIINSQSDPNLEINKPFSGNSVTIEDLKIGTYIYQALGSCETDTVHLENCSNCLQYASVFFPGAEASTATDSLDITFGPVYVCLGDDPIQDIIKDYEFRIFNRWGQEVFMSNDPLAKWDGKWNDELVPSEAYIYVAKYFMDLNLDGVNDSTTPNIDEGDITVIR